MNPIGSFIGNLRALRNSPIAPFHNDLILQAFVTQCVEKYKVGAFVETGTFRADTLLWFANKFPDIPCFSTERNKTFYRFAMGRTLRTENVTIKNQDSREFLKDLHLPEIVNPLFWLDAHWESDWPLLEELRIIQSTAYPSIVLIDDFKVPNNTGFGFDTYDGKALDYPYIRDSLVASCEVWLPNYLPQKDNRGVCVLFFGLKGTGQPWFTEQAHQ